ncbi:MULTISPECIES: hypothetical protein [unclassified Micromonospora]|uniref:hypothetical protein n=1 Tax=unclassified Micromonospora TaxID=2617518 RepID=UPI00098D5BDD|nr:MULTISPECIES: hypothetical protein [unclassified Micromonospora]MDI5936702.1 hypothetical protein [Micromonospora sp. DH15]OON32051.1 hypothetical protein BSA16_07655 [Micromonospora sp. Rc5]
MSIYGLIKVGPYTVARIEEGEKGLLLAILRDDAMIEPDDDDFAEIAFRMPGHQVADRLDVIGVDQATVFDVLREAVEFKKQWNAKNPRQMELTDPQRTKRNLLDGLDGPTWVEATRAAAMASDPHGLFSDHQTDVDWLLDLLGYLDYRFALRLGLLAFPDEQVTVTLTDRGEGWLDERTETIASHSLRVMQVLGSTYSPTVVLTEGRTDAEFLSDAMSILYPHLTDLVRFLNFETRPDASASALVKSIKSFAAAGITNRIVALFDNDSAAADARRGLDKVPLPENIIVDRYPDLHLARDYPTLGPPSSDAPNGVLAAADVNGLAGSIELYLGHDVLKDADGNLRPVQWTSFLPGVQRYQGEVIGKAAVQQTYRAKVAAARRNEGRPLRGQDWSGLNLILRRIIHAHNEAT